MNFDFSDVMILVFISWVFSAGTSGLIPIFIAGVSLFSRSLGIELLLLLSLTMISFVISTLESRRTDQRISQLFCFLRISGCFIAMGGHAMLGGAESSGFILFGLLITLPHFFYSIIFKRHFVSLSTRAYLYSIVLPSLMTLDILSKVRSDIKVDLPQVWDISLSVLGLGSLMGCALLAFLHTRTKPMLVFLSQSWIGLGIFLLVPEQNLVSQLAFASLLSFCMTAPKLILLGKQCGKISRVIYRMALVGLPGFLGFSIYYYSIKSVAQLHTAWICAILLAYLFQAMALMMNDQREFRPFDATAKRKKINFALTVMVQLFCSAGFYWIELMGMMK